MKHIIFSLFLLTILTGCTPPHIKEAHRVMDEFSYEKATSGFSLFKQGGAMMEDIEIIDMGFYIEQSLSIDQVRLVLLSEACSLIEHVNADAKIQPYLRNHPFILKNVGLSIMFLKNDANFAQAPYVAAAYISGRNNQIVYTVHDSINNKLVTIHKESFDEALNNLDKNSEDITFKPGYHLKNCEEKILQNSYMLRMSEISESR